MEATKCLSEVCITESTYAEVQRNKHSMMLADAIYATISDFIQMKLKRTWVEFDLAYYVPEFELIVQKASEYPRSPDFYPATLLGLRTEAFTQKQINVLFVDKRAENPLESTIQRQYDNSFLSIPIPRISVYAPYIASAPLAVTDFISKILNREYKFLGKDADSVNAALALLQIEKITLDELNNHYEVCKQLANLLSLSVSIESAEQALQSSCVLTGKMLDSFTDSVLCADEKRADIERYDQKCLEDVNLGHWELWQDVRSTDVPYVSAKLEKKLVARNPLIDIRHDGIVGIDFGTKSTIVSCQDGSDNTKLLRIGMGQLSKKAEKQHYENPTVMEFISLDSFMESYRNEDGRPHTDKKILLFHIRRQTVLTTARTPASSILFFTTSSNGAVTVAVINR